MKRNFIIIPLVVFLSACGGTTAYNIKKPEEKRVVDLTSVKPNNFNALATNYMNKVIRPTMKDPSSMKLKLSGKLNSEVCENKEGKYKTWNTLVGINAKNSYGAYTGMKPYKLFFVNGKVVSHAYDLLLGSSISGLTCVGVKKP